VPGAGDVVLSDTVGFINQLPHDLVDAFKATLEEVSNADLLLHVVDAGCRDIAERMAQVRQVLAEIGAADLPTILVFNKIDQLTPAERRAVLAADVWSAGDGNAMAVAVSAVSGEGLEELTEAIGRRLGVAPAPAKVVLPAEDGKTRAWLYRMGAVLGEEFTEDGRVALQVRADADLLERLGRTPRVLLQVNDAVPRISPLPN
jgi:GTP-binding protein HflX